jgi:uncharacterized hydrophobic protein (TIGR00271 family)
VKRVKVELSASAREALYRSVLASSHLDLEYVAMLAFSGLIALFGLLQNSVAVIIGAMLISPLMNPILAAALALILGDWSLGRRAAAVLGWSIGGVIALTWLVAWLTPLREVTPEILARTNPNLLDLLVAILAGLAGTLALRSESPAAMSIIPGVAIAVAVIPPLATVGYSLSNLHGSMARGAFLLFLTNLVSIILSAASVFIVFGFRPHEKEDRGHLRLRQRMAISALVLVVLAVPLIQTLRKAVAQANLRSAVASALDESFKTPNSTVADMSFSRTSERLLVHATVRTTQYFQTPQIDAAEDSLRKRFGSGAKLTVDQILVTQGGLSPQAAARIQNFISGGVVQPVAKEEPFNFQAAQGKLVAEFAKQVDETLLGTEVKRVGMPRVEVGAGGPVVCTLHLTSPEPLETQTLKVLASQLSAKISLPAEIHGQVDLTGQAYVLNAQPVEARRRLGADDRRALANLLDVLAQHADLRLAVQVSAAGLEPDAVKKLALWRDVHYLLVRSRLKAAQWDMEAQTANPPAATPAAPVPPSGENKPPAPPAPGPIRTTFRVTQVF